MSNLLIIDRPAVRVVGLDLSLTSSGMSDGFQSRVRQTSPEDGPTEARFESILDEARRFVDRNPASPLLQPRADLVVIESGAFSRGAQAASAEQLAGLRFLVRHWLWSIAVPFAMVTPTGLKAYVTGHGVATKQQMAAAVHERYGIDLSGLKVSEGRYDVADAFGLAAMGYHRLGHALRREGPPPPLKSLQAVRWPEMP